MRRACTGCNSCRRSRTLAGASRPGEPSVSVKECCSGRPSRQQDFDDVRLNLRAAAGTNRALIRYIECSGLPSSAIRTRQDITRTGEPCSISRCTIIFSSHSPKSFSATTRTRPRHSPARAGAAGCAAAKPCSSAAPPSTAAGAAFGHGQILAIVAASLAGLALIVLLVNLTFDFDASARAHAASGAHLWGLRERYRSLLSDLHDGALGVDDARLRRDQLIDELRSHLRHDIGHRARGRLADTARASRRKRRCLAAAGAPQRVRTTKAETTRVLICCRQETRWLNPRIRTANASKSSGG